MTITEACPFSVNLWAEDELSIERVLATAASISIARAAFDIASVSYPTRTISLMGQRSTGWLWCEGGGMTATEVEVTAAVYLLAAEGDAERALRVAIADLLDVRDEAELRKRVLAQWVSRA